MARAPTIEIPVTVDLKPAARALLDLASSLEVTAAFLKSKAEELLNLPTSEHYRTIGAGLLDGSIDPADLAPDLDSIGIELTD